MTPRQKLEPNDIANLPRNVTHWISPGTWGLTVFLTFIGWALGVVNIGLSANSYVQYKRVKRDVENFLPPPARIEVDAPNILASGIIILILACIITLFFLSTFIWVLCHSKAGSKARGFFTSGASIYIPAFVVFVLSWLFLVDLSAYSNFLTTGRATIHIWSNGGFTESTDEVIASLESVLGITPYYKDFSFLRNVAIIGWIFWFFTLLISCMLFAVAADGDSINDTFLFLDPNPGRPAPTYQPQPVVANTDTTAAAPSVPQLSEKPPPTVEVPDPVARASSPVRSLRSETARDGEPSEPAPQNV